MPLKTKTEPVYLTPDWRFYQDGYNFVLEHRERVRKKNGIDFGEKWEQSFFSCLENAVPWLLSRDIITGRTLEEMKTRLEQTAQRIISVIQGAPDFGAAQRLADAGGSEPHATAAPRRRFFRRNRQAT